MGILDLWQGSIVFVIVQSWLWNMLLTVNMLYVGMRGCIFSAIHSWSFAAESAESVLLMVLQR